jgi:hypothetical protein
MRTMHRIMPRSFGRYALAGQSFVCVESEEIMVEHQSLPFEDYLECREMDLSVEILHNGKVYEELQALCRMEDLSWFDFIMRFHANRRNYGPEIAHLYDEFRTGNSSRLWEHRHDLERAVVENIDSLLQNERGTNEMSVAKATAFFEHFGRINAALFNEMRDWLRELNRLDDTLAIYLDEMERFSFMRKTNLLHHEEVRHFNVFDLSKIESHKFNIRASDAMLREPQSYIIAHSPKQREQIDSFAVEFGHSPDGLGKMLMRYPHVHRIFRHAQYVA